MKGKEVHPTTETFNPKIMAKGLFLKQLREVKSKQQIMNFAKRLVNQKDSRLRRIAENVYELKRAELMAALDLERGGTQDGFFSQVGTNLDTPASATKRNRSAKKTPQKSEQSQQTSPMLELPGVALVPTKTKSPPSASSMTEMFKRVSPKALTPQQEATLAHRFRHVARNMARGAAMLGLADPPEDPRAKRKLLITPGGTPGLPA